MYLPFEEPQFDQHRTAFKECRPIAPDEPIIVAFEPVCGCGRANKVTASSPPSDTSNQHEAVADPIDRGVQGVNHEPHR